MDCIVHMQAWAVSGGSEGITSRFYELVPEMALDFPFELDKFQKEVMVYTVVFLYFISNRSMDYRY